MILDIVVFTLVLSFLVIIHELGHYFVARFFRIRVEEFGLGYPPKALTLFHHGKTAFTLNWIPFGGFVKMEGEEGSEAELLTIPEMKDPGPAKKSDRQSEGPFYSKTRFARLSVTVAGATINFLFGILAFCLFFSFTGIPQLVDVPRVGGTLPDSPAAVVGIPNQVQVLSIELADGTVVPVSTTGDVISVISARPNQAMTIVTTGQCELDGLSCQEIAQRFPLTTRPKSSDSTQGEIGVRFSPVVTQVFYPWYEMPVRGTVVGLQQTAQLSRLIFEALGNMGKTIVGGSVPSEVGSPIKIFVESRRAGIFEQGPAVLLHYAGIISINLAIFNIMPIPALDGGRVVMILLEYVIGRKRVSRIEGYVNYVGLFLLGGLMIFVFARDIFDVVRTLWR